MGGHGRLGMGALAGRGQRPVGPAIPVGTGGCPGVSSDVDGKRDVRVDTRADRESRTRRM